MDPVTYSKLIGILTAWDAKEARKRCYNVYAFPQYIRAANEARREMEMGRDIGTALKSNFCGPLLRNIVKKLGVVVTINKWD